MMDSSEPVCETVKGSTGNDESSMAKVTSKDPSPTLVKGVRDAARSAGSSNQSTPLPSRRGSGLSGQSSTTSVKRPEVNRKDSARSATRSEVPNKDLRSDQHPPRNEQPPDSRAPTSKQPQPKQSTPSPSSTGEYAPSGGGNGLNDLHNCHICGSYDHYSAACDNPSALAEQFRRVPKMQCRWTYHDQLS